MSTWQLRSTDKAILQMIVKLAYDLRLAEARFRKAVTLSRLPDGPGNEAKTQAATYWSCSGRRDAIREMATPTLQICAAMPPARRREAWVAFRSGWRLAGKCLGGAR
jgi:hypothetical protein